jgi:hypothetical protein
MSRSCRLTKPTTQAASGLAVCCCLLNCVVFYLFAVCNVFYYFINGIGTFTYIHMYNKHSRQWQPGSVINLHITTITETIVILCYIHFTSRLELFSGVQAAPWSGQY